MYVLIDNYDSFTYNLVHFLGELGAEVSVFRNDSITPGKILKLSPEGIILSPGPRDPSRAGICLETIKMAAGTIPILGVCLGHQSIGQAFGAKIVRAPTLMHGKLSKIIHDGVEIFSGLKKPFLATRYHSLMVSEVGLPAVLRVTARTEDGVIMGLRHQHFPIFGVQFHPESIASEHGHHLLKNFLQITSPQGEKIDR
ncbi:MAG: aminodeoxychorismate/anthranilate synthase component II [Rhodospirillaceae bacterium]|nr:aminodeoxychorismate/anthranilate synthase component II [Rhodospirillaceae bacterium]|tara:strand:+ start:885 stop:1478 length:594 start_codon:yes stop_codon:yes gene_type:complete